MDNTLRFVVLESPAFLKYLRLFEDVDRITTQAGALIINEGVRDGNELAERMPLHPLLAFAFLEDLAARRLLKVSSRGNGNAQFGKTVEILSVSPQFRRSLE